MQFILSNMVWAKFWAVSFTKASGHPVYLLQHEAPTYFTFLAEVLQ
jgi:hypothetical protein